MSLLLKFPYRVLIVEDEVRDWLEPMFDALKSEAEECGYSKLEIVKAQYASEARNTLAKQHFHVVSFDLRLPERKGEVIAVETGIVLARSFPYIGFPKHLLYTATVTQEAFQHRPDDAYKALKVKADHYAKASGSDSDSKSLGAEVLTVEQWAKRICDNFDENKRNLPVTGGREPPLTLLGAYLHFGPNLLPPILASHLQDIANCWDTKDSRRNDDAIRFIETTARLALIQSAVLLSAESQSFALPPDNRMANCLDFLQNRLPHLNRWNWSNYLTEAALQAFREALSVRNDERHSLRTNNTTQLWASLRLPLQYAMDVAAYWVRHPLCINLRYSRDGWTAELLAGTGYPRKRRQLPDKLDFPVEAVQDGVWQSVWRIDDETPQSQALCWGEWLKPDEKSERSWWLPMYLDSKNRKVNLDLDSGNHQTENPREAR